MTKLGEVILPPDTLVNRPAFGIEGRIFFATDTLELFRDSGLAWESYQGTSGLSTLPDHNHTSTADDGGVLTNDQHDGYIEMAEIAAPSTPAANKLRIYPKDKSGEAVLYYKSDAGTEYELPTLGAGGGGTGAPNFDDGATPANLAAAAATGDDTSPSRRDHVHLDPVIAHLAATDPHVLSWKRSVRVASTATRAIATELENGDTIDGVILATGDRVLLKDQSTAAENGIYVVPASGAASRAADADAAAEVRGMVVVVEEGTANADTIWLCTTNAAITLGSTSLAFVKIYPAAQATLAVDDLTDVVITSLTSGDVLKYNGSNWVNDVVTSGGGGALSDYILIEDQQTSGTTSGSFASGAWRTRPLNTEVADTGNFASVASNQITLAAGTYRIRAWGMVYAVARNAMRLQNITDATTLVNGSSSYSNTDASAPALLDGRFTLAAQKVLEIQHRCETTSGTHGFGVVSGTLFTVDHEVYTRVELWKE